MQFANAVVLVVEDEILIRMDVVDQLSAFGYSLIEASSAREALEALDNADTVDILFTDVDMPGDFDGLLLAHKVAETRPEIGIIVTSGKTLLDEAKLPDGCRFYPKPYVPATVNAAIQAMLTPTE